MTTSSSNTARKLVMGGIGLLLCGCCFWSGLIGWLFAPFSPYMANFITAYPGKAELIARAEWSLVAGGSRLMAALWCFPGSAMAHVNCLSGILLLTAVFRSI